MRLVVQQGRQRMHVDVPPARGDDLRGGLGEGAAGDQGDRRGFDRLNHRKGTRAVRRTGR
jgi:hypothetical protein